MNDQVNTLTERELRIASGVISLIGVVCAWGIFYAALTIWEPVTLAEWASIALMHGAFIVLRVMGSPMQVYRKLKQPAGESG